MEQPIIKHGPPTMGEFGRSIDETLGAIRADIDEFKRAVAEKKRNGCNLMAVYEDIRKMADRMAVAVNAIGGMLRFFGRDETALQLNKDGSYVHAPEDVDERFHFTLLVKELLYADPAKMAIVAGVYMSKRYDVLNTLSGILGYAGVLAMHSGMEGDREEKNERMINVLLQAGESLERAVSTCRAVFDTSLPEEERRKRYADTMEIEFRINARMATENSRFVFNAEMLIDKSEFADRIHSIALADPEAFIRKRAILLCTDIAIISRSATEDPDEDVRVAAAKMLEKMGARCSPAEVDAGEHRAFPGFTRRAEIVP